jgi:hypothetical protein
MEARNLNVYSWNDSNRRVGVLAIVPIIFLGFSLRRIVFSRLIAMPRPSVNSNAYLCEVRTANCAELVLADDLELADGVEFEEELGRRST